MHVFIYNAHRCVVQNTTILTTFVELARQHIVCITLVRAYFFGLNGGISICSEKQPEHDILQISYEFKLQFFWYAVYKFIERSFIR